MEPKSQNKRWSADEATKVLDRADASGLSDLAFARKTGITGQRVSWWREKLGRRRGRGGRPRKSKAPEGFVEVQAKKTKERVEAAAAAAGGTRDVEIRLVNGRSVVVAESMDLGLLERLLVAVEGRRC